MTSHSQRRRSSMIRGEDYYEILQVSRQATDEEVKQSYRRLALQYHPDKNSDPDAKDRFQSINKAYKILGDPKLRSTYDLLGAHATDLIEHYHYEEYPATLTEMSKCKKCLFALIFLVTLCGCGCFGCCFCCGGFCCCKCFCNDCCDHYCCDHCCGKCASNRVSVKNKGNSSIRQQPTNSTNHEMKF